MVWNKINQMFELIHSEMKCIDQPLYQTSSNVTDFDPCEQPNDCTGKRICVRTTNTTSYTCQCPVGYVLVDSSCINIDECSQQATNNCSNNATCTDTLGSYTCTCQSGYQGDGFTCECKSKRLFKKDKITVISSFTCLFWVTRHNFRVLCSWNGTCVFCLFIYWFIDLLIDLFIYSFIHLFSS